MHQCALIVFVIDVITIDKTGENFRLLYDVKGRFTVHRITNEEAKVSVGILVTLSLVKMSRWAMPSVVYFSFCDACLNNGRAESKKGLYAQF